jgi:hypothetical protein
MGDFRFFHNYVAFDRQLTKNFEQSDASADLFSTPLMLQTVTDNDKD